MSGLIVTGPPRSGTSAVTRLLDLAGAYVCIPPDRLGGGPNNPTGHWESRSVLAANNRLLVAAATRWWCPPAPGAAIAATLDAAEANAFRAGHPAWPWLCKDPRFAFTLPVWRKALEDVTACVILLRRPDEVVASLRRTWRLSVEHAGALWMRYLHGAISAAGGVLPIAFVRFPELLADVNGALAPLAAGLAPLGVELDQPSRDRVDQYVRVPTGSAPNQQPLPATVWCLWEELTTYPPDLLVGIRGTAEHPSVEGVLAPLRDELRAGRPLDTRPVFARAGDAIG